MTRCRSIIVHVCMCVSVCLCVFTKPRVYTGLSVCVSACMHIYVRVVCARPCVCYAWRHTCSNRVVVDSDSCPVPFTAQSSQPPLCSVRLLMRINVLWRPLGLPHSPPTAQLMKKYNLAKILRQRERATQTEKDWETTWERGRKRETLREINKLQKGICKKTKPGEEFWGQ